MKKLLTLMTFFLLTTIPASADSRVSVKLSDGHSEETIKLEQYVTIVVKKGRTDDDGNTKVSIEVNNNKDSDVLVFFGQAYSEKKLKGLTPSIKFDKIFPLSNRVIETYEWGGNDIIIRPSSEGGLPQLQVENGTPKTVRLPFYIAGYQKKSFFSFLGIGSNGTNKLLLKGMYVLTLTIEVEAKPDEDYVRLERAANGLITEIGGKTFCPNRRHQPSLQRQEAPYKEKINRIKNEIQKILDAHPQWFSNDNNHRKYDEITRKLDAIDFTSREADCGRHGQQPKTHSCKYCGLSPEIVYHRLHDIYLKIHNRRTTKEAVRQDVELLYNCPKNSAQWKKSGYSAKIVDTYNRINNN